MIINISKICSLKAYLSLVKVSKIKMKKWKMRMKI